MSQQLDAKQFIEKQRQDWNRVAPAWEKWDQYLDHNLAFISHRMVGDARLRAGQCVLDLGCGTGYPSILAAQIVGSQGAVVGLDLSEAMLTVARRKAKELGLSNMKFQAEDISNLQFESTSFDAVISRFCLMFLPEIPRVVKEIERVLKPGGYAVAAVWSTPDKNPFIRIPMEAIKRYIDVPQPSPGQPGIFRLSKPGDLLGIMKEAGLNGLTDDEITGESLFESAEEYLMNIKDLAAPLQPLFARLTPEQKNEVDDSIKNAVKQYQQGDKIVLPMAFRIVASRKP